MELAPGIVTEKFNLEGQPADRASVLVSKRPLRRQFKERVLFLHGQFTDAELAHFMLDQCGFVDMFDVVVPEGLHESEVLPTEYHALIGVDKLVKHGFYAPDRSYKKWGAGYDLLCQEFEGQDIDLKPGQRDWDASIQYLCHIVAQHGPFDGVIGFCEGTAVLHSMLHLQQEGQDVGLGSVKFFVAMAPWMSPRAPGKTLHVPTLLCGGFKDLPIFHHHYQSFKSHMKGPVVEYQHAGAHVYPEITTELTKKLKELLLASCCCFIQ